MPGTKEMRTALQSVPCVRTVARQLHSQLGSVARRISDPSKIPGGFCVGRWGRSKGLQSESKAPDKRSHDLFIVLYKMANPLLCLGHDMMA